MRFFLRNIELNIDDALIEQAEDLLSKEGISEPAEIEKHLWMAKLKSAPFHEVEVQLAGKKVKDYTCECSIFSEEQICLHIVASLLDIRKKIRQYEEKKSKRKVVKKLPQRLTVAHILKQARPEDLADFVRNYARQNKKFAIALSARFAGNVPIEDNSIKYMQLIESALKSERGTSGKIKSSRFNAVYRIIEEIHGHAQDAISLNNFSEAFDIIKAVFGKVPLVYQVFENKELAKQLIRPFSQILHLLGKSIMAPVLREQFRHYCFEQAFDLSMIKYAYFEEFLKTLLLENLSQEELFRFTERIDTSLKSVFLQQKDEVNFRYYQLITIQKLNHQEAENKWYSVVSKDYMLYFQVAQKLFEGSNYTLAAKVMDRIGQTGFTKKQHNLAADLRLKVACQLHDKKTISSLSQHLFLESFNFEYFDLLKDVSNGNQQRRVKRILKLIKAQPESEKINEVIARIYWKQGENEQLLGVLASSRSLRLLQLFDGPLLKSHKEQVYQLYSVLLENYLQDHLGTPASAHVRQIMQHLFQSDAADLAKKLIHHFRKNYAWRPSLIENLEIF